MIAGLDEMLLAHAKQNDLQRIDIGAGDDGRFIATVWWHQIDNEIPCASENGANVLSALGSAIDKADRRRIEAHQTLSARGINLPAEGEAA